MKKLLILLLFILIGCGGQVDYYDADGNPLDENPIYLDANGVTVKAKDWAEINFIGKLNGLSYIIVDSLGLRKLAQGTFKVDFFDGELQPCTSRITNMNTMFQVRDTFENDTYEENFTIDYENVDDSELEISTSTGGAGQYIPGDLSSFDVSNVTSMDYMFALQRIEGYDFSYWDVSNVVSMKGMFFRTPFGKSYYQDCNLTCDWNSEVRTPEWMEGSVVKWTANGEFITTNEMGHYNYPEKYLKYLKIDRLGSFKWDELPYDSFADFPQELKDIEREMRRDIERYNNTDDYEIFIASKWAIGKKVNQMGYYDDINNVDIQFPAPVGEYVVKGGSGSNEANILLKVSPEGVIAGLKPLGVGLNHEGKVPDKYLDPPMPKNMFQNWDLSNLKDMSYMFFGSNFNLPISNWDVSNVESMAFTFGGVDVSNSTSDRIRKMFKLWRVNYPEKYWSKEAQKEIYKLSYDYSELSSLFTFNQDISSWNVSNVKCINRMFYGNYQFDQDLSKWDLSHLDQCREFDVATWNWDLPKPKLNCNKKPSIYKEFDKC
tara:strand:+ start:1564 stop:3201 length:1638 start_codon:yes stop_codon:yes gene_type:complete